MGQSPSSVPNTSLASQGYSCILCNPQVQHRGHNSSQIVPILGHINPDHTFP